MGGGECILDWRAYPDLDSTERERADSSWRRGIASESQREWTVPGGEEFGEVQAEYSVSESVRERERVKRKTRIKWRLLKQLLGYQNLTGKIFKCTLMN